MRQIVLDTETTGLEVSKGHRLIEIGAVELSERRPTGRTFHRYLNPQRAIDEGAQAVHGISLEFLADKPLFADVADDLIEFIRGAELVIHNAAFDLAFLDNELLLSGGVHGRTRDHASVLDTLLLAREKYPGQKNNLDALCKRLDVNNSHREFHGALLDAQLLAEVYLAMTTGQGDLGLISESANAQRQRVTLATPAMPLRLRVCMANPEELAAHEIRLDSIAKASKGRCVWRQEFATSEAAWPSGSESGSP